MDPKLFSDLVQSLKEAKDISSGKTQASRRFVFTAPDVKSIREKTGLSQSEFAKLIRVSLKTIQNWEQRRRNPTGAAAALLTIVGRSPDLALMSLNHQA